jgi:hypothetical protein
MPLVTFRDDATGDQVTVRADYYRRETGRPDKVRPSPGDSYAVVQVQYEDPD